MRTDRRRKIIRRRQQHFKLIYMIEHLTIAPRNTFSGLEINTVCACVCSFRAHPARQITPGPYPLPWLRQAGMFQILPQSGKNRCRSASINCERDFRVMTGGRNRFSEFTTVDHICAAHGGVSEHPWRRVFSCLHLGHQQK